MRSLALPNVLLACLLMAACSDEEATCSNPQCGPCEAKVGRVMDGDTIELTDGTKVRYLLVDTPESTGGKKDCYGEEAAAFNEGLVVGKTVHLDYESDCSDMFGRLLAYVTLEDRLVNNLLIERGYACVLFIEPNGADKEQEFKKVQAQAKAAKKGMWGACEEVTCEN